MRHTSSETSFSWHATPHPGRPWVASVVFTEPAFADGRDGSLTVHQDVALYRAQLTEGGRVEHPIAEGRAAWIQVIEGEVEVNGHRLLEGDGAAVESTGPVVVTGAGDRSDVLLFDLA